MQKLRIVHSRYYSIQQVVPTPASNYILKFILVCLFSTLLSPQKRGKKKSVRKNFGSKKFESKKIFSPKN